MEIAGSPGLMGDHLGTVALLISLQASRVASHVLPAGLSGEDHASWDRRLSSVLPTGMGQGGFEARGVTGSSWPSPGPVLQGDHLGDL